MKVEEQQRTIEEALLLLEKIYVHLPLKRAMHAVEPLQRLKLLAQHLTEETPDLEFHNEILSTFTSLRDRHTCYVLPEPYFSAVAFLPFRIQRYFENNGTSQESHYMITEVSPRVKDKHLKREAIITHWNGIPIEKAIQLNAEREEGNNPDARLARGLEAMTIRPLGFSRSPDETWVTITYEMDGQRHETRLAWEVMKVKDASAEAPQAPTIAEASALGVDSKSDLERRVGKILFAPEKIAIEHGADNPGSISAPGIEDPHGDEYFRLFSKIPQGFAFRAVKTAHGTYGYIRIHTFNFPSDNVFVDEFIRIAGLLPQNGLILDVRGNGGGNINAGERLLQVLTPKRIEPERFYFINSPLTLQLCQRPENGAFTQWAGSISQSVQTGAVFSQGFPLLSIEQYNDIGQKYHGPVVLLTDALCYSTTDIFCAGFQDHGIGKILGVDECTGAGGANVLYHSHLLSYLPGAASPFKSLPNSGSFRLAVRRCARVGEHLGEPIEELGVRSDERHFMTKRDLLEENPDLIEHAAQILATLPKQSLSIELETANGVPAHLVATTSNITRLDLWSNERPHISRDVADDGVTRFDQLPTVPTGSNQVLELRGFRDNQLVASTRVIL